MAHKILPYVNLTSRGLNLALHKLDLTKHYLRLNWTLETLKKSYNLSIPVICVCGVSQVFQVALKATNE